MELLLLVFPLITLLQPFFRRSCLFGRTQRTHKSHDSTRLYVVICRDWQQIYRYFQISSRCQRVIPHLHASLYLRSRILLKLILVCLPHLHKRGLSYSLEMITPIIPGFPFFFFFLSVLKPFICFIVLVIGQCAFFRLLLFSMRKFR